MSLLSQVHDNSVLGVQVSEPQTCRLFNYVQIYSKVSVFQKENLLFSPSVIPHQMQAGCGQKSSQAGWFLLRIFSFSCLSSTLVGSI